jgi:hypothetical protein
MFGAIHAGHRRAVAVHPLMRDKGIFLHEPEINPIKNGVLFPLFSSLLSLIIFHADNHILY